MQLTAASKLYKNQELESAEIHPSPNDMDRWIILVHTRKAKSFFIVDEHENVRQMDMPQTLDCLRRIGFRSAEVYF